MKSVNITELKNRLSVYLNDVKAGEAILVRDRNQPVARIVPLVRSRDEDGGIAGTCCAGETAPGRGSSRRVLLGDAGAARCCRRFAPRSRTGAR